jgi:hypothetical protein
METTQSQTEGQRLVGITFNPSGDPKVNRAKELCAELFDLVNNNYDNPYSSNSEIEHAVPGYEDPLKDTVFQSFITDCLKTQMMAVKLLTWK